MTFSRADMLDMEDDARAERALAVARQSTALRARQSAERAAEHASRSGAPVAIPAGWRADSYQLDACERTAELLS